MGEVRHTMDLVERAEERGVDVESLLSVWELDFLQSIGEPPSERQSAKLKQIRSKLHDAGVK